MRITLALLAAALLLPAVAHAEGTPASEIQRTDLWSATSTETVHVWPSGSQPCTADIQGRDRVGNPDGRIWRAVPIPCDFQPDPGSDREAIIRDQTDSGKTYELWTMGWHWNEPPFPNGWSAGYVTTGPDGVQGSGIRYEPGLPRLAELANGVIPHMVQIEVPVACSWFKAPAIRSDGSSDPNCIPYGQQWRLPAGTDCAPLWTQAARMVCTVARDYGLIATDQTHSTVQIRFEEMKVRPADGAPYYSDGGYFGCGTTSGPYCWPTTQGAFQGFPWDRLVAVN